MLSLQEYLKKVIHPNWYSIIGSYVNGVECQKLFSHILNNIEEDKKKGHVIFPEGRNVFNAFKEDPFQIKVVILGQDPYHRPGQAHGLSFSVLRPTPPPPSLQNIYKELKDDLKVPIAPHGDLSSWASQGVFLLNAVLTVREGSPQSHATLGWQTFTSLVLSRLSTEREKLVFLLWGSHAQNMGMNIDRQRKHLLLKAPHPSPLSAYRGFLGCRHFSQANTFLQMQGLSAIDWNLNESI